MYLESAGMAVREVKRFRQGPQRTQSAVTFQRPVRFQMIASAAISPAPDVRVAASLRFSLRMVTISQSQINLPIIFAAAAHKNRHEIAFGAKAPSA